MKLRPPRRWGLWLALLVASLFVHVILSSRVADELYELARNAAHVKQPPVHEMTVEVEKQPLQRVLEPPPPQEAIEFEKELEMKPPEILIAPQAVKPPPPDVPLTLKADAGGAGAMAAPAAPAQQAQPRLVDPNGIAAAARVPAVGALSEAAGAGTAVRGVGIGNALGDSSNQFAAYLQGLRDGGLDVVFVVDATGSMDWVISEVKARITDIVATVRSLVPTARFGLVAYRDTDEPGFLTKTQRLTYSTKKLRGFLHELLAEGGGDMYEDILEGLKQGIDETGWQAGARRIVILVGDAGPHRDDMSTIVKKVERFAASGGIVSTLDVSDEANPSMVENRVGRKVNRALYRSEPMYEFRLIADAGNGDAATLEQESSLTKRLIILIIGDQFARQMQALLDIL
ncbi:MAG: VWA domain-containing protein [Gammaproteobacteria bacterium]|nr:VWA domain-containing protein [Gammaproteobacteria bacterium]